MKKLYSVIKFVMDEILSLLALVVLFVPFLFIGIIIKCTSKGSVFFIQKRVGKNKKLFNMHKFRTMRIDAPHDQPTHMLENPEQYITPIGRLLRKTSIDELPQIWDIFRGKMSIIGPRPALWNQYDLIEERDKYGVNDFRPALTGWAQTHGRDENDIPEKAELDGYYVEHFGFIIDCKCFFLTIAKVLKFDGVVEGGTGELIRQKAMATAENAIVENIANEYDVDATQYFAQVKLLNQELIEEVAATQETVNAEAKDTVIEDVEDTDKEVQAEAAFSVGELI